VRIASQIALGKRETAIFKTLRNGKRDQKQDGGRIKVIRPVFR